MPGDAAPTVRDVSLEVAAGGSLAVIDFPGTQDVFAGLMREQAWWRGDGPRPSDDEFATTAPLGH